MCCGVLCKGVSVCCVRMCVCCVCVCASDGSILSKHISSAWRHLVACSAGGPDVNIQLLILD